MLMLRRALFACLLLLAPAVHAQDVDPSQPDPDQVAQEIDLSQSDPDQVYWADPVWAWDSDDPATPYPYGIDTDQFDPASDGTTDYLGDDTGDDTWTPWGDVIPAAYRITEGGDATLTFLQDSATTFRLYLRVRSTAHGNFHSFNGFISFLAVNVGADRVVRRGVIPVVTVKIRGTDTIEFVTPPITIPGGCRVYAAALGHGLKDHAYTILPPILEECDMFQD